MEMKRFIILLDSRFRGNDGSNGFPLPRLRGHRLRGNDRCDEPGKWDYFFSVTFLMWSFNLR
jgi:hypothetical protein